MDNLITYRIDSVRKQAPLKLLIQIYRNVSALSLYTVTHKFTLSLIAHKGKYKGKKIS